MRDNILGKTLDFVHGKIRLIYAFTIVGLVVAFLGFYLLVIMARAEIGSISAPGKETMRFDRSGEYVVWARRESFSGPSPNRSAEFPIQIRDGEDRSVAVERFSGLSKSIDGVDWSSVARFGVRQPETYTISVGTVDGLRYISVSGYEPIRMFALIVASVCGSFLFFLGLSISFFEFLARAFESSSR